MNNELKLRSSLTIRLEMLKSMKQDGQIPGIQDSIELYQLEGRIMELNRVLFIMDQLET